MFLLFVALDLSVALMELHEICEVYTEAKYAYGERGRYVL